jgi:hypothetical protein
MMMTTQPLYPAITSADITVVVQGAIMREHDYTPKCLASVRRHLPHAEVILSTWQGSNVSGLEFDVLVENEDPGAFVLPHSGSPQGYNTNRQLCSSLHGIQQASRPYVLKLRSDGLLISQGFINQFNHEGRHFPQRNPAFSFTQRRLLNSAIFAVKPNASNRLLLHPSDHYFFGTKADMLDLFGIPLIDIEEALAPYASLSEAYQHLPYIVEGNAPNAQGVKPYLFCNEIHLWSSFLAKHKVEVSPAKRDDLLVLTEQTFANNLMMLEFHQSGIHAQKYYRFYADNPLKFLYAHLTHNDWLGLYKAHCDNQYRYPWLAMKQRTLGLLGKRYGILFSRWVKQFKVELQYAWLYWLNH